MVSHSVYWLTLATCASLVTALPTQEEKRTAENSYGCLADATYDYIVVGGGLTGLVMANRLTENRDATVLVVEYGKIDRSFITMTPFYANSENYADLYNITATPEPGIGGQSFAVLAGAVVGGGSVVNGMEFDRASAADYDSWEELGNPGWGWSGLLPYFQKSTTFTPPSPAVEAEYHYSYETWPFGTNGPIQASFPPFQYPDTYKFWSGFAQLKAPFIKEGSAGDAVGVFNTQTALDPHTETRSDALTGYHDPAASRPNFHLTTGTKVTTIIFSSDLTAEGVQMTNLATGKTSSACATKEVIMAAGAVHTPQILQMSGIGPKAVLQAAGVKVKLDLPAVGNNFQDHPVAYVDYNLTKASFPNPNSLTTDPAYNASQFNLYETKRLGAYTEAHGNSAAWLSINDIYPEADSLYIQAALQNPAQYLPAAYSDKGLMAGYIAQKLILLSQFKAGSVASYEFPFNGGGFVPNALQKPLSRGTVYLNASNPSGNPVVSNRAFTNPVDKEQVGIFVNYTRKVFNTAAVQELGPVELVPGKAAQTGDEIFSALEAAGLLSPTFAHPSCSCAMMPQALGGCVSPELLVYGTKKLSIIDSSIMPLIPATHLQSTMYAIGEKAADIVKARA